MCFIDTVDLCKAVMGRHIHQALSGLGELFTVLKEWLRNGLAFVVKQTEYSF